MTKIIRGSGGPPSPPPPRQPTRTPDTLHSRQFATFLDLISEGEIEGFATASKEGRTKGTAAYRNAALKDVFLDNTPVLQANANSNNPSDRQFNHKNVGFAIRFGTGSQAKIKGLKGSGSIFNVGTEVKNGNANAITRQLTNNPDLDAVRVTVTVPVLQNIKSDGDIVGS